MRETFSLAVPADPSLERVTRFSGWWLDDAKVYPATMELVVDGVPAARLQRVLWHDLARALPNEPRAAAAGFVGDLVLPEDFAARDRVSVGVAGCGRGTRTILCEREYDVTQTPEALPRRERAIDLTGLLSHPEYGTVEYGPHVLRRGPDSRLVPIIAGVPHFHPAGALPLVRLTDMKPTHKLGAMVEALLGDVRGVALDFGAGVPNAERLRDNVVNLDLIHFPNIDVVSSYRRLPFRDAAFELVFSLATFEHLPDPRGAALEVARVLSPGGLFFIDVAFMQPLHGDPDHYFNMTMSGVREILSGFDVLEIGVKKNHRPSLAISEQITAALPLMREGAWKSRLEAWLDELRSTGDALDTDLGSIGREMLAAGVYALARKP